MYFLHGFEKLPLFKFSVKYRIDMESVRNLQHTEKVHFKDFINYSYICICICICVTFCHIY